MWICQNCKEELEDSFDTCWKCGTLRDSDNEENRIKREEFKAVEKENNVVEVKYDSLRTMITLLKVFGWIIGAITVITGFILDKAIIAAVILAGTFLVIFYSKAENIKVNIDIEENTRINAINTKAIAQLLQEKNKSAKNI